MTFKIFFKFEPDMTQFQMLKIALKFNTVKFGFNDHGYNEQNLLIF